MFQEARHAQELTDANCAARIKLAKLLLQKFPQSATNFAFFTDEKVFSVASPDNRQNDRVYAPRDTRKQSIAAERLLHTTFSNGHQNLKWVT